MELNNYIYFYILFFFVLPLIAFYNIKIPKYTERSFLSKNSTDSIKGLLAIIIIIHHFSQTLIAPKFLVLFSLVGYLCVGVFFFLSGYGLSHAYYTKERYLDNFFTTKISRIYIPFVVCNLLIGFLFFVLNASDFSILEIIVRSITLRASYSQTTYWFPIVMLINYFAFYVSFKGGKGNKKLFFLLGMVVFCVILANLLKLPQYWFNNFLCFPIGAFMGMHKNTVVEYTKKYKYIVFLGLFISSTYFFVYPYIFSVSRIALVSTQILASAISVLGLTSLLWLIKLNSKPLIFLSKYSFEIYLVHLPLIRLYSANSGEWKLSTLVFIIFASVLISASANWISDLICSVLFYKSRSLKNKITMQ